MKPRNNNPELQPFLSGVEKPEEKLSGIVEEIDACIAILEAAQSEATAHKEKNNCQQKTKTVHCASTIFLFLGAAATMLGIMVLVHKMLYSRRAERMDMEINGLQQTIDRLTAEKDVLRTGYSRAGDLHEDALNKLHETANKYLKPPEKNCLTWVGDKGEKQEITTFAPGVDTEDYCWFDFHKLKHPLEYCNDLLALLCKQQQEHIHLHSEWVAAHQSFQVKHDEFWRFRDRLVDRQKELNSPLPDPLTIILFVISLVLAIAVSIYLIKSWWNSRKENQPGAVAIDRVDLRLREDDYIRVMDLANELDINAEDDIKIDALIKLFEESKGKIELKNGLAMGNVQKISQNIHAMFKQISGGNIDVKIVSPSFSPKL